MPIPFLYLCIPHGNARSAKGATTSESEVRGVSPQGEGRRYRAHLGERSELNNAFTLIEMSIVVAVIGLLIGGVLVGKNMYRTAKLQQLATSSHRIGAAIRTFRDTYNGIPGDITNATDYWGLAGGTTAAQNATCNAVNSTTLTDIRATCNGNGDGASFITGITVYFEIFRGVQQLSNAGLIPGKFTGKTGTSSTSHGIGGTNLPSGPLPGSVLGPAVVGWIGGSSTTLFGGPYGTYVRASGSSTTNVANGALLSAKEVLGIDGKLDDGLPGLGNVVVGLPSACTNADSIASFNYGTPEAFPTLVYTQTSNIACYPIFRNM